jgi:hypothetical protein
MKVQFETPSNGSKPQTLRSSRTANRGSITISWRTACIWASEHGPGWFQNPLSDGHTRRMLRLTRGHFRYLRCADSYLDVAMRYAHLPVKEAVISPSALSLMYQPKAFRTIRDGSSELSSRCDTVQCGPVDDRNLQSGEPCVTPIRQLPHPCCVVDRIRGGRPRSQCGWPEPTSRACVRAQSAFFRAQSARNPPVADWSGKPFA